MQLHVFHKKTYPKTFAECIVLGMTNHNSLFALTEFLWFFFIMDSLYFMKWHSWDLIKFFEFLFLNRHFVVILLPVLGSALQTGRTGTKAARVKLFSKLKSPTKHQKQPADQTTNECNRNRSYATRESSTNNVI